MRGRVTVHLTCLKACVRAYACSNIYSMKAQVASAQSSQWSGLAPKTTAAPHAWRSFLGALLASVPPLWPALVGTEGMVRRLKM